MASVRDSAGSSLHKALDRPTIWLITSPGHIQGKRVLLKTRTVHPHQGSLGQFMAQPFRPHVGAWNLSCEPWGDDGGVLRRGVT